MAEQNPLTVAALALRRRARDPRMLLIAGLADDLVLIANALDYVNRGVGPHSATAVHSDDCECRECCLRRLAAAHRAPA
jgi:hypothetical protein